MDRVLLIIDDIQYCRHVEMTLRKVGFDVESLNNEFNLSDSVLTFNPEFIICRGNSSRLSTLNVGKKLGESNSKFTGKVILIFAEGFTIPQEDLIRLKMDLLLFEPISTLKLAMSLFSLSGGEVEFVKDKLLKFAITDTQFRNYEQQMLRTAGVSLDTEIQAVSEMSQFVPPPLPATAEPVSSSDTKKPLAFMVHITGSSVIGHTYIKGDSPTAVTDSVAATGDIPEGSDKAVRAVSDEIRDKLKVELTESAQELPLRIDSYNRAINKVDQDLSVGLKKRQTRKASNQLQKDLIEEKKADKKSVTELDLERIKFTKALFKK